MIFCWILKQSYAIIYLFFENFANPKPSMFTFRVNHDGIFTRHTCLIIWKTYARRHPYINKNKYLIKWTIYIGLQAYYYGGIWGLFDISLWKNWSKSKNISYGSSRATSKLVWDRCFKDKGFKWKESIQKLPGTYTLRMEYTMEFSHTPIMPEISHPL